MTEYIDMPRNVGVTDTLDHEVAVGDTPRKGQEGT